MREGKNMNPTKTKQFLLKKKKQLRQYLKLGKCDGTVLCFIITLGDFFISFPLHHHHQTIFFYSFEFEAVIFKWKIMYDHGIDVIPYIMTYTVCFSIYQTLTIRESVTTESNPFHTSSFAYPQTN